MRLIQKLRFSMGTILMFVLMAGATMALFVQIQVGGVPADVSTRYEAGLVLLALVLTAVTLGSYAEHTAVQIMLQVTLACFSCLSLTWISQPNDGLAFRYWFQVNFAVTVALPILARRFVKSGLPRGLRRDWWKKTCEAIAFSFLTMVLVSVGDLLQMYAYGVSPLLASITRGTALPYTTYSIPAFPTSSAAGVPYVVPSTGFTPGVLPAPVDPDPALENPPPPDPPSDIPQLPAPSTLKNPSGPSDGGQ
jgi:hypothetical protein